MDPWGVRGSTNQQPTLNTLTFINEKESLKRDTAAGKKVVDERYWKEEEEKKSRWHKVGWPLRWHKSPCLQVCGTALRALFSALLRRPRAQMGSSHFKNIFVASSPDISSKVSWLLMGSLILPMVVPHFLPLWNVNFIVFVFPKIWQRLATKTAKLQTTILLTTTTFQPLS